MATTKTKKSSDGKRSEKVAESLRGELMTLLLTGAVHDPGVQSATVSAVKLTDDLRLAKVYVRTLDLESNERTQRALIKALERAKGFLRRELAQRLALRYAPDLRFYYDEGLDRAIAMEGLLRDIAKESVEERPAAREQDDDKPD